MITAIAQPIDRMVLVQIQTGPVSYQPHYRALEQAQRLHAALGQALGIIESGPASISFDLVRGS